MKKGNLLPIQKKSCTFAAAKVKIQMTDKLKEIFKNNKKVAENYVFMTLLQILNIAFYLIIYPVLIRRMGQEAYGLYAFSISMTAIVMVVINFGFDLPGTKRIATIMNNSQNDEANRNQQISDVLSHILTAKTGIEIVTGAIFAILIATIPLLRANYLIFCIAFVQTVACLIFPQWYYQGIQQMRNVTYIQFACKMLSLPFILIFVRSAEDVWLLMLITTAASVAGGMLSWIQIRFWHHIRMRICLHGTREYYKEAVPFFLSNAMGIVKEQGIVILAGAFLGMADVAIYDLANKIVTVPRIMLLQLNNALYPKMAVEMQAKRVRRILWSEIGLGLGVIVLIAIVGKWVVLLLGGEMMLPSYPVSILLSTTVLLWMLGTAYIDFIFVPSGNNKLVTWNQLVALCSCMAITITWLLLNPSVYAIVAGITISGLCEIIFCASVTRKKKLLRYA